MAYGRDIFIFADPDSSYSLVRCGITLLSLTLRIIYKYRSYISDLREFHDVKKIPLIYYNICRQ